MFNIYDMLQSGMSVEEVAEVFTKNLNDAENKIKAEEAEKARLAEEAARAEQERIDADAAKRHDFAIAVRAFLSAAGRHYPNLEIQEEDITDEAVDAIAGLVTMLLDLETSRVKVRVKPAKSDRVVTLGEDPFATFFKQFGL